MLEDVTGVQDLGEEEGATHLYQRAETGVQDLGEGATHHYRRVETGVGALREEEATHLYQREAAAHVRSGRKTVHQASD